MKYFFLFFILKILVIGNEGLPSWYFNPPSDDGAYLYGVGEGETLRQAKDDALSDIASKLSVTISSKMSKNAVQTTFGDTSSYSQNVNVNLESEVKKIAFNNFDVVETGQNGVKSLVLVKVDKAKFLKDQQQILMDIINEFDRLPVLLAKKSILEKYRYYQSLTADVEKSKTIISILSSFEVNFERENIFKKIVHFKNSMESLRSGIEFYLISDKNSRYNLDILKEALAKENIKLAHKFNSNNQNLVILNLETEVTNKEIFGSYVTNARTKVTLKSKDNITISTVLVESNGNSSIDSVNSLKSSGADFERQLAQQGVFEFLGIN